MSRTPISVSSFKLLLLLTDIGALVFFFNISHYVRLNHFPRNFLFNWDFAVVIAVVMLCLYVFELFSPNRQLSGLRPPARFWLATTLAAGLVALYLYLSGKQAASLFGR